MMEFVIGREFGHQITMLKRRLDGKDVWVRKFEVSNPQKHKKGFTVYKVVSTVFPRNFPEGGTVITVWKRYKEFKGLHRELEALFHQLYLKGTFPSLPKERFFGRFDSQLVEERRLAALNLLEFAAQYTQLFMNKVFVKFFEDGYYPRDFIDNGGLGDEGNINVRVEDEDTNFEDCLVPEKVWQESQISPNDEQNSSPSFSCASPEPPETPVVPSLPMDPVDNASSSIVVDTLGKNDIENTPVIPLGEHSYDLTPQPSVVTFSDASARNYNRSNGIQTKLPTVPSPYSLQDTKNSPFMGSSASLTDDFDYMDEFCGIESRDTHVPNSASSLSLNARSPVPRVKDSLSLTKSNLRKYAGFNLFDFLPIFTKKQDKTTDEQNLSHSLSSYIREAAGFISVAQHHESNADYSTALDVYTEGIRVLLEGAQGDQDSQRRALAKRKVQKYLSHAEELKQKINGCQDGEIGFHNLAAGDACSGSNESHSEFDFFVVNSNVMPSSIDELKNYKVVGSTYNNVLVAVDITARGGPDCFAIKVMRKSSSLLDAEKPSLIPNAIPFMVKLLKWFNTEDAIVLILQYAAGGRLLNFVNSYQTKDISVIGIPNLVTSEEIIASRPKTKSSISNIATGSNLMDITPISSERLSTSQNIGAGDFVGNSVKNKLELDNLHVLELGVPFPTDENGIVLENNIELTMVTGNSTSACASADLQTDDLIQSSRALLKTVSRTLETQHKASLISFDSLQIMDSLMELEIEPLSTQGETKCNSNPCAAFMVLNSANHHLDDKTNSGEGILPVRTIPERCVKVWGAELVIALSRLHSQGVTYGDLDIHNILLGDNGHILLSYRALWNEIDSKSECNLFSAPEVVGALGKALWKSHPSADWWSLGAILYFLLTGVTLQDTHPEGMHPQTIICVPPSNILGESLSSEARTFLVELLHFTPTSRLGYYGAEEIKSHPFFVEFDWEAAESSTSSEEYKPSL